MDEKKNVIILFENQGVKLEVNLKEDTVWLTQKQMAELFEKDRKTITRHIQNIYKDGELEEKAVCSFFEHTAKDGKHYRHGDGVFVLGKALILNEIKKCTTREVHFFALTIDKLQIV